MSVDDIKELVRWRDKADELATLLEQYSAEAATKTLERDEARRERDVVQRELARLNAFLSSVWQALRAERDEAQRELVRLKARPAEAEIGRLDVMWQQLVRERDEARAEVEHAYREGGALYEAKIAEREAFRRGAEAMREACARWMSEREGISQWVYDDALSALPIPREP